MTSPISSCGGLTRTDDLWVMSPTSYQLLHSAMFIFFFSCGGLTRTDDLWVMSPTSYQLLHSAMLFLICECKCKGTALNCKKQIFKQKNQTNEVKEVKHIMKILLKSLHNVKNGYDIAFFPLISSVNPHKPEKVNPLSLRILYIHPHFYQTLYS